MRAMYATRPRSSTPALRHLRGITHGATAQYLRRRQAYTPAALPFPAMPPQPKIHGPGSAPSPRNPATVHKHSNVHRPVHKHSETAGHRAPRTGPEPGRSQSGPPGPPHRAKALRMLATARGLKAWAGCDCTHPDPTPPPSPTPHCKFSVPSRARGAHDIDSDRPASAKLKGGMRASDLPVSALLSLHLPHFPSSSPPLSPALLQMLTLTRTPGAPGR